MMRNSKTNQQFLNQIISKVFKIKQQIIVQQTNINHDIILEQI